MLRVLAIFLFAAVSSLAAVTSVELVDRGDVLDGKSFGPAGPYERVVARAYFAVDPNLPQNRIIADIDRAPRDEKGLVEFSADLYVLKPRDSSKGNGTALVEISNRGGKGLLSMFDFAHGSHDPQTDADFGDKFLLQQGFTLVWVGWEFDVPRDILGGRGLMHLYAPVATDHSKPIEGLVRSEWEGEERVNTISLGDRAQRGYPVANAGDPENVMYVRPRVDAPREIVPRNKWRFADETHVTLDGGFDPGRIYEVVYKARGAVVVGLGPAAVRDVVSFVKHGEVETLLADQHEYIKRVLGFGVSQSGRFLRLFLRDGFNEDEKGRIVFDGVWAHVAGAGTGSFNFRFAQPSRDGNPFFNVFYPTDVPPFSDDGLLAKAREAKVVPKIFYSNGSYEYWGRAASLIHTTPDGKRDVAPAPDSRIYFFAGTEHGPGRWPPERHGTRNRMNPAEYRYLMRALLGDMQAWLKDNTEPPASVYPRIDKDQLVAVQDVNYPKIPGLRLPLHKREAYRLDFSTEPPKAGTPYVSLVPQVDRDGIDEGGVRLPEVAVPLATYLGWNLRSPTIGAPDEMSTLVGSWIPFAGTRAERESDHDPRESIEERYPSKRDYLDRVSNAALELVRERFMLSGDIPLARDHAAREWDYVLTLN